MPDFGQLSFGQHQSKFVGLPTEDLKELGAEMRNRAATSRAGFNQLDTLANDIQVRPVNVEHKQKFHIIKTWSKKHKSCIICKTTKTRHLAFGLCQKCYDKKRRQKSE